MTGFRNARFAVIVTTIVLAAPMRAQVVSVQLRERETSSPIAGAVVRLLRDQGVVAQALSNAAGRAGVQAPHEGTYRVRVNRIGYAALVSEGIVVRSGEPLTVTLEMATVPVVLPAFEATAKSQCGGRFNENELAGVIWEQIRTALAASVVTQRERAIRLRVRQFRRELTSKGEPTGEAITGDAVISGRPFAAPSARSLIEDGFATFANDEMTFSAPDADLFLSDEFAMTHCFRAVAGASDSVVGIAFEPAPRRRQSDVRGTFWMTRATSELRLIEFAYTNLPVRIRDLGLGGRVDFQRLPNGVWIINYWHIRMPRMAEPPQDFRGKVRSTQHLAGFVEVGGRAEVTHGLQMPSAVLRGSVFDSTTLTPLVGAVVKLAGTTDSVITEADGRYWLVSKNGGPQTVTVMHPKLGIIDDGSSREVQLSLGETVTASFSVPPSNRFAAEFCGSAQSQSGVLGFATTTSGRTEGLDIRVTWTKTRGALEEERSQSGPRGLFVLCDLPTGHALRIHTLTGATLLAERTVTLRPGEYLWIDLNPN